MSAEGCVDTFNINTREAWRVMAMLSNYGHSEIVRSDWCVAEGLRVEHNSPAVHLERGDYYSQWHASHAAL